MSGSVAGGKAAARTNKLKYGSLFYVKIGKIGGSRGRTGGFAWMKANGMVDKIREAGRKGGSISRRGKAKH